MVHLDWYHPREASDDEEEDPEEDPKEDLVEEEPQREMGGWGPEHGVHPYPEWNDEEDDADDQAQAMVNDEDIADDEEHDTYLDWVPLEEEDRPRDSDMG